MIDQPQVVIELDQPAHSYAPGGLLSGTYEIRNILASEIAAVELSILWYTEGKGDEDMAVHEFQRRATDDGDWIDTRPVAFKTTLPMSPMSYDGLIMKIRWCVRVRVFRSQGKELFSEMPFTIGEVEPASFD